MWYRQILKGPAELCSAGNIFPWILLVVIHHKKDQYNQYNFDVSYNLLIGLLYFYERSATIIATFVRPGKTQMAESGDLT